nr:leucine-rich repeat domain-containing protein [Lachnospiraceae bacterium]
MYKSKRIVSFLLAFALICSTIPRSGISFTAYAEETASSNASANASADSTTTEAATTTTEAATTTTEAATTTTEAATTTTEVPTTTEAATTEAGTPLTPNYSFNINSMGIITEYLGNKEELTEIVVPDAINGIYVTGIGEGALADCPLLTTVYVPESMVEFGAQAFARDYKLKEIAPYSGMPTSSNLVSNTVVLPKNTTLVSADAFLTCSSIFNFGIDINNPNYIAADYDSETTFAKENLTDQGLTIGHMLLTKDKIKLVRQAPNSGITTVPSSVQIIGDYAFEAVHISEQSFTFPASVTTVGDYAFYKCNNMGDVYYAEGCQLSRLGAYAFAYNENLRTTLPASITYLGDYCYTHCRNIKIDFALTNILSVPAYCFYECDNLRCLSDVASAEASGVALPAEGALLVFPASLETIEAYAFKGCNNLNTIFFLGDSLKKLGTGAFQGCGNLHYIDIPEGVVEIENNTFDGCQNLNTIILPDTVEIIGDEAFKDNRNIHELVIPESVTQISNSSFTGAKTDEIDTSQNEYSQKFVKGTLPYVGEVFTLGGVKYKVLDNTKLKVEVKGLAKKKKVKKATIPKFVWKNGYKFKITKIGAKAFKGCKKLKTLTILTTKLKKVGKNAFKGTKAKLK